MAPESFFDDPDSRDDLDENLPNDPNFRLYRQLRADPQWLQAHIGQYVAIVAGQVVGLEQDRQKLIDFLRLNYPKRQWFFALVEEVEHEVDVTGFEIEE